MVISFIDFNRDDENIDIGSVSVYRTQLFSNQNHLQIIARESQYQFVNEDTNLSFTRAEVKRIEVWIE